MTRSSLVSALSELLPLGEDELEQILQYTSGLDDNGAIQHLQTLLGNSSKSFEFISFFLSIRETSSSAADVDADGPSSNRSTDITQNSQKSSSDVNSKVTDQESGRDPPPYAGISASQNARRDSLHASTHYHTNDLIEVSKIRARDEQQMIQLLQQVQLEHGIYNSEIEPEHDSAYPCDCSIHRYLLRKWARLGVQERWAKAVMYPGEKFYSDSVTGLFFGANQYQLEVGSPYGTQFAVYLRRPQANYHARYIRKTNELNRRLNREAQNKVDALEPKHCLWEHLAHPSSAPSTERAILADGKYSERAPELKSEQEAQQSETGMVSQAGAKSKANFKFPSFRKTIGMRSTEQKTIEKSSILRNEILKEELGRWPDSQWRQVVMEYQERIGISKKVADLRNNCPLQYLHLLRAGYFEPISVEWATDPSNPLKFKIEAASGWRGITPAWRGFEDLAEERLYWVLNHREGSVGTRMKPDLISTLNMARERMAQAVEPPPVYSSADDTCHLQNTSAKYSKQVLPKPFEPYDCPESPTDDTMILLDVSGSMDFEPVRPVYDQYLITGYVRSSQPKNKDVARSIIRRFIEALSHGDQHHKDGYDLVTFSSQAEYIGTINHGSIDKVWRDIVFGGGTRVMAGWQQVKELHFQKHSQSAYHHPVYGWQAGPDTPMLRLLLLLDGEAIDMDEFELDLLSLNWAHVTIFLIGVDGCPHHHRHANELQRISDVNRHVSFVDAQGSIPERYVTHELLKRHLGYDLSIDDFRRMEGLPSYSEF